MYKSLEEFYDDDPRRRLSPEADYGVQWSGGQPRSYWRVSYVHTTGEVYAMQLTSPQTAGRVEVLAVVPPDMPAEPGGIYYHTLDRVLEGWAGESRPISWVRQRLLEAGYAPPPADA